MSSVSSWKKTGRLKTENNFKYGHSKFVNTLLVIDNYDSFTYNIVNVLHQLEQEIIVFHNDQINLQTCLNLRPQAIILGPGPGTPLQANLCLELLHQVKDIPLLGICLGMQAIGLAFGGNIVKAKKPMHGKLCPIYHSDSELFSEIPQGFQVTRYNSLLVERQSLPSCLEITAQTSENEIMGLKHIHYPIQGVQFHPEAIATEYGLQLFKNWVNDL